MKVKKEFEFSVKILCQLTSSCCLSKTLRKAKICRLNSFRCRLEGKNM